jgi:hypothetical protein
MHNGVAGYYSGKPIRQEFEEWLKRRISKSELAALDEGDRKRFNDAVELVRSMLDGYPAFAKRADDWKEVVAVEKTITQKIPGTEVYLRGSPDLIVRRKGRLWIVEHKSYVSFVDPRDLELDDQMTAYCWLVLKEYGQMPAGAIYNQFRKKIPKTPQLLKNGTLSKKKNIDTTYAKYVEAVKKYKLRKADYEDVLKKISFKEFYRREIIARSPRELTTFEENLKAEALEMTSVHTVLYPNATHECNARCIFTLLCKAENEGGDLASLIEHNYVIREGRDE